VFFHLYDVEIDKCEEALKAFTEKQTHLEDLCYMHIESFDVEKTILPSFLPKLKTFSITLGAKPLDLISSEIEIPLNLYEMLLIHKGTIESLHLESNVTVETFEVILNHLKNLKVLSIEMNRNDPNYYVNLLDDLECNTRVETLNICYERILVESLLCKLPSVKKLNFSTIIEDESHPWREFSHFLTNISPNLTLNALSFNIADCISLHASMENNYNTQYLFMETTFPTIHDLTLYINEKVFDINYDLIKNSFPNVTALTLNFSSQSYEEIFSEKSSSIGQFQIISQFYPDLTSLKIGVKIAKSTARYLTFSLLNTVIDKLPRLQTLETQNRIIIWDEKHRQLFYDKIMKKKIKLIISAEESDDLNWYYNMVRKNYSDDQVEEAEEGCEEEEVEGEEGEFEYEEISSIYYE
jgi:hypothetical protein